MYILQQLVVKGEIRFNELAPFSIFLCRDAASNAMNLAMPDAYGSVYIGSHTLCVSGMQASPYRLFPLMYNVVSLLVQFDHVPKCRDS